MSTEVKEPPVKEAPANQKTDAAAEQPAQKAPNVKYSTSAGLSHRLRKLNASFAFSSYQSGLLYFVGSKPDGGINIHQIAMPKPMGISLGKDNSLALSCGAQLMRLENFLTGDERANEIFDACFVPREIRVTGRLDAHDIGQDENGDFIFVNTRYNCLSRISQKHSFEEVWRPHFISALVSEDRCHLNGLAMENGKPRYVTAVSRSDTVDGWRDRRADGGVVIDVERNKVVCGGLSMPHSPRMYNGRLFVASSGHGQFGEVKFDDTGKGTFAPIAFCPGFIRGVDIIGKFAFLGLSKPRYERFEGLALDEKLKEADSEPWCGVQVIDLETGACVDWLRIDGDIAELYDVELLPGFVCPMAVPPHAPEAASIISLPK